MNGVGRGLNTWQYLAVAHHIWCSSKQSVWSHKADLNAECVFSTMVCIGPNKDSQKVISNTAESGVLADYVPPPSSG